MTTQPTHTHGPWHIGMRPGPMVYGPLGEQVADCRGLDESGYNARLIAAAPEMLNLCIGLKKYAWANDPATMSSELKALLNEACNLIAKAEGRG